MKTITAKFASICPACQKQIRKGSPINYEKACTVRRNCL